MQPNTEAPSWPSPSPREREMELLRLVGAVATEANASQEPEGPIALALRLVSCASRSTVGHAYLSDPEHPEQFVSLDLGEGEDPRVVDAVRLASPRLVSPGDGTLAGEAVDRAGVVVRSSTFAVPILVGDEAVGALTFVSFHEEEPDEALIETARQLGIILGRVVERERVRQSLEASEARVRDLNRELEERVGRRTAELARAVSELEAFAYSVSHDLRAPLRAMDGFSQAVLEDYSPRLDDEGRDMLERIRKASQRMATLMDDLLRLSRIGRSELHIDTVDLGAMAGQVMAALRESDPERTVELRTVPGLEAEGDPNLLGILLDNLLGNAWKFTRDAPAARIEVGRTDHEGRPAFFVRDNGPGFDPRYADKLFAPFQRLHREAEFPGNGIGLATVQRIVRMHGGRVWAEGAPGAGATFYFTLDPTTEGR